jgi:opacity protein-like surface antigen
MYLQKGASEEEDGGTVDIKLAYIELPVLFKLQFGTGSTKPYLMAGPTIGLNLSADMEVGMGDLSLEVDFSELIETIDYGLAFGGGVSFAVGENSLFIEARYNLGLADIAKEGEIDIEGITLTVPETEIKTSGIQIMAGMTFPL